MPVPWWHPGRAEDGPRTSSLYHIPWQTFSLCPSRQPADGDYQLSASQINNYKIKLNWTHSPKDRFWQDDRSMETLSKRQILTRLQVHGNTKQNWLVSHLLKELVDHQVPKVCFLVCGFLPNNPKSYNILEILKSKGQTRKRKVKRLCWIKKSEYNVARMETKGNKMDNYTKQFRGIAGY